MTKLAAIYGRVSTRKQKEGENVESQIEALSKYAHQQGYKVPEEWILKDEGYTGATLKRPGLDALRELVREYDVDAVFIFSPDRFSRKLAFQMLVEMEFQKRGVRLFFLNTPPAETPEERFMLNLKGVFAEYERAQISERARRGKYYRARQGLVNVLSGAPYGYKYNKKGIEGRASFEIDQSKSDIVKTIFRWYLDGLSMIKICKQLTESGIAAPRGGGTWGRSTIRQILKNPTYTGAAYFGKTEVVEQPIEQNNRIRHIKGKRRDLPACSRRVMPRDSWIPISVPQIIGEVEFETVQEKIEKNKEYSSRNTSEPTVLQGLIVCGSCGHPYYKKMRPLGKGKTAYYCCSNHLKGGGVETCH